jgi:hypothetical protein
MAEEHGGLHEKIIAIICEEWPKDPDNRLESTTIRERLEGEDVAVSQDDLRYALVQLASAGEIELVIGPAPPPKEGMSMTIRFVSRELCE